MEEEEEEVVLELRWNRLVPDNSLGTNPEATELKSLDSVMGGPIRVNELSWGLTIKTISPAAASNEPHAPVTGVNAALPNL